MAATGIQGIDVLQTAGPLVLVQALKDSVGAQVTTGTTLVWIDEVQADGSFKSFDFTGSTFKTTALGTPSSAATHQMRDNGGTPTGVWTKVISTVTGFTVGATYVSVFSNALASPPQQERRFQFGGTQGDPVAVYGSVNDAGATTTGFVAATGLSAVDDWYKGGFVVFQTGNLQGEPRKVSGYTGATRTFAFSGASGALDAAWPAAPDNLSRFIIVGRG